MIKNLATLKSNMKKINTETSIKEKINNEKLHKKSEQNDDDSIKRVDVYLDTDPD